MILPKENNSCFLYHQTTFPTTNFHCISLLWKMNYSNSLHISSIIILTYQGFTSLCYLLLFPYSNCQDCFLLWNVLHMQMLELARLGTSPLSTTGEKKLPESEDFHAVTNFNISCSSKADHRLFFPNYCFGWTIWFLELVEEHQKSTRSKQGCWEHNTG